MMPTYDSPVVWGAIAAVRSIGGMPAVTAAKLIALVIAFTIAAALFWRLIWNDYPQSEIRLGSVMAFCLTSCSTMWLILSLLAGWP